MMNHWHTLSALRRRLVLLGLVLILGGFNWSVFSKEQVLRNGSVVRLRLAPVDPRALMTGDYMALNTELALDIGHQLNREEGLKDGYAVVTLDPQQRVHLVRIQPELQPLQSGELALFYRFRDRGVRVGNDAFYFQEGQGERYQKARYGEFRVNSQGVMLLTRLLDEQLQAL